MSLDRPAAPDWITRREAEEIIGVGRVRVLAMIAAGQLDARKRADGTWDISRASAEQERAARLRGERPAGWKPGRARGSATP